MRIVFISHDASLYGANRSLLGLLQALVPYGVKPMVLLPAVGPFSSVLEEHKIPYHVIPFAGWLGTSKIKGIVRFLQNLFVLPQTVRVIRNWQADLVYSNSSATPQGAFAARWLRLPHLWHVREFGYLDFGLRYDLGKPFFSYWMNQAQAIISVSHALKQHVLSHLRPPVHVVYNGVISAQDLPPFSEAPHNLFTFCLVGRLHPGKGQDQAIRAFAEISEDYPQAQLVLVGSGEPAYETELRRLCHHLHVANRVVFKGYVHDPFDAFLEADVVLMCSPHEAMGRVTAEAMCAGKPVIGFAGGGTTELIEHSKTGLLYQGAAPALAEQMRYMLEHPEVIPRLGKAARAKALRTFTLETYGEQVFAIIQQVLSTNKRS